MLLQHQTGMVIASRYRLGEVLGRGGTGVTYAAKDLHDNEASVAIKVVSLRELQDWKSVELLDREAEVLAKLDHPAIPAYIDYFHLDSEQERNFYIVQKLAPGKSLATSV